MAIRRDPEGKEIACLRNLACFAGARVVELGCGDGRLTVGFARQAAEVIALDPDESRIQDARANLAFATLPRVEFRIADARCTGIAAGWSDIVLFTRSL